MKLYDFNNTQMTSILKKKALSDVWFLAYCVTDAGQEYYQTFKTGLLLCPLNNRQVKAIKPIDETFDVYFKDVKETL